MDAPALMKEGRGVGFSYDGLEPDLARAAQEAAERIRESIKVGMQVFIEVGRDLTAIKERLEHGQFTAWVEAEFDLDLRTAENYMNAFLRFGDKSETVSLLPQRTIYKLAAKSTPASVREEVVSRLEAGERPASQDIEHLIQSARRKVSGHQLDLRDRRQQEAVREAVELLTSELDDDAFRQFCDLYKRAGRQFDIQLRSAAP